MESTLRRTWAEIDLDALAHNYRTLRDRVGPEVKFLGVVKADAYGHGAVQVSRILQALGADYLAVSSIDEATELRCNGITMPILILGHTPREQVGRLIDLHITQAVSCQAKALEYSEEAVRCGGELTVHIKVDTGMSRLGYLVSGRHFDPGTADICAACALPGLRAEGIFTHFAKSDEEDKTSAYHQLELFQNFIDRIQTELGLTIPVKHCSNSAAILEMPQANMDMVRAGITTYGLYPSEEVSKDIVPLRAAMSLYSHIVYCKTIHAGQSVSYGGLFTAQKDTRVATIPVGYGDGYPRSLSGKGYVLIRGKKAPILGRVCMDQFMVDISEIPGVMEGDKVTLLGVDGTERITAEELGELSGRFNYEFVCDLGKRIPRVYRQHGEITEVRDYFENF